MYNELTPGTYVVHPTEAGWGLGQVQSSIGGRVTVNFENAGKVVINTAHVVLVPVNPDDSEPAPK